MRAVVNKLQFAVVALIGLSVCANALTVVLPSCRAYDPIVDVILYDEFLWNSKLLRVVPGGNQGEDRYSLVFVDCNTGRMLEVLNPDELTQRQNEQARR